MATGDRQRLRLVVLFDAAACATAVVVMLIVWATVFRAGWLLVCTGMVAVAGLLMLRGLRPLRAGSMEGAVRWLATANWLISLGAAAVATFSWPLMALTAVLPAVFSVPYARGRQLRWYLLVSVLVSTTAVMLGLLQDLSGMSAHVPEWIRDTVLIGFTPILGIIIAILGIENSAHLHATLDEVLATNTRLRNSDEELRASRSRLVSATDRERRRIERDLHDGAQQRLVALSMRLSIARELCEHDPEQAAVALDALRTEVKGTQLELRRLARGLYPAVLTEHGLAEALRAAVDQCPHPVETTIAEVGRHSSETEAAVYFCCVEALQNVAKHAGPRARARLTLALTHDGDISFEIADDGAGFNPSARCDGNGLTNMADRLGASGGTLELESPFGFGASVRGRVASTPNTRAQTSAQ